MAQHQIVELECPGCAAIITTDTKKCPYCFRPIVITTWNPVSTFSPQDLNKQANAYRKAMAEHPDHEVLNMSLAFCYLKLKLYDKASSCFEKALDDNFEDSEAYFYAAVALLKGKKAFLTPRSIINKIEEYLNAAIMIEPKGIYYYFLAYIKYDYYYRKYLKATPDYRETLDMASASGYSEYDVDQLFELLNVKQPDVMRG